MAGTVTYTALCPAGEDLAARATSSPARVDLSRHVAHCTDGCARAAGQPVWAEAAYERAPTRRKLDLPGPPELAAMLLAGATLVELADRYDRTAGTIRMHLNRAGFNGDGTPATPTHDREALDPFAGKPFEYEPWRDDALCSETDPESFFPEKGGSTREAKATCARCTVAAECLDYALQNAERYGIWGGLSERERRRLLREIAAPTNFPTSHASQESA